MTTTRTKFRPAPAERPAPPPWETEAFVLRGADRGQLAEAARALDAYLEAHPATDLTDLAYTVNRDVAPGGSRLGLVAKSAAELRSRLARAIEKLADPACEQIRDTSGLYWFARPLAEEGKVAFLFPGEGAQYPGMLRDVVQAFPEAAAFLAECDADLARVREGEPPVSSLFLATGDAEAEKALHRLDNTMLSVLLADGALYRVVERLGLRPAFAAGHSMGEMAALSAAGCVQVDDQYVMRFGATMKELARQEGDSDADCALLAVGAGQAALSGFLDDTSVYLAMDNCPHQTVLVGTGEEVSRVQGRLQERGLACERLTFRRPYHTPLFEPFLAPLRELFGTVGFGRPNCQVYSCTTAEPFPDDPAMIRDLAIQHWAAPVRFTDMVRAMYDAGARVFVEVGPRGNLSAFVEDILRGQRFAALPANVARRPGLTQLNHLVAQLAAHNVPMSLAEYYAPRSPRVVELSPKPAAVLVVEEAAINASGRAAVMEQYLGVMEQFLDTQREVTEAYLGHTHHRGFEDSAPATRQLNDQEQSVAGVESSTPRSPGKRPLLGDIVRLVPGQEVVTRRLLDLDEDRFALDHTVGGRMVSKADPDQHGVPVTPMTFTLEILAEAAGVLVPDRHVIAIRQIRLLRWLAFEPDEPALIEVSAKLEGTNDAGEVLVKAEIRDFGPAHQPNQKGPRVASGVVVFATEYPAPPAPVGLPGDEPKPITMTVEQVYHNLFHGPMFQGVTRTIRGNDVSIEAEVEVLTRDGLFRSVPRPDFHFDPVLLDVVLHPLATWHLHQPDLAGRIMLPVGIDAAEFFAPPAPPGTGLVSRSWISEANLRSFTHGGEVIAADGSVYLRLAGVKCWRFYVPFGEVNFHGPKDQYFLGRRWTEVEEKAETPFALVRLEVPPDLKQPAMSRVTAQVTLTAAEIAEFRRRTREAEDVHGWLFDRIAAKDAIRLLWHDRTDERLYPADIECQQDETKFTAHRRGVPGETFDRSVVARAGNVVAALSTTGPACGLAVGTTDEPLDQLKQRCLAGIEGGENYKVHVVTDGEYVVAYTLGEGADA